MIYHEDLKKKEKNNEKFFKDLTDNLMLNGHGCTSWKSKYVHFAIS